MDEMVETEVELPPAIFQRAEELAEEMKVSRDVLYALALQDFIERMRNAGAQNAETQGDSR